MMKEMTSRLFTSQLFFWIIAAGIGAWYLWSHPQALRFGLDLVGGTYITLETQTDKAVEAELLSVQQTIAPRLKTENGPEPVSSEVKDNQLSVHFSTDQQAQVAQNVLQAQFAAQARQRSDLGGNSAFSVKSDGSTILIGMTNAAQKRLTQDAIERNVEVLRTRLNPMGVGEVPVAIAGDKNIVVELPNVADPLEAKRIIGKPAQLEFKLVEGMASSREELLYEYDGELPGDKEIVPSRELTNEGLPQYYCLVSRLASVSGKDLRNAKPAIGDKGVVIEFELSAEAGNKFGELTGKNIGKSLAIVLDDVVISAPRVNTKIQGKGYIEGGFTDESARELAMLLKSGAFVAPVTFEEERQIGPSLGAESIRQGFMACMIGLGLLLLFSVFVYRVAGFLAFLALLYNLFGILLGMSLFGATLTLPGIFGMVLTSGMAIDASILIYERIKEELATGIPLRKAVEVGFSDAMTVILDANITTFIVGVVLYKFGTGPVQGFAVTMMLGIISTLLTGLFFLRSLFTALIDVGGVKKLYI